MESGQIENVQPPAAVNQLTCGACGTVGHMRTNKNCPLFKETYEQPTGTPTTATTVPPNIPNITSPYPHSDENIPITTEQQQAIPQEEKQIKREGTKFIIPKEILNAQSAQASSSGLIVRIPKPDPTKMKSKGKRKREEDTDTVTKQKNLQRTRRRRSGGVDVAFSNLLEKAWTEIKRHPYAFPFLKPVNHKEAPDYYLMIKHPMDLGTIRDNIRAFKYTTRAQFMADFNQMVTNCEIYNRDKFYNAHLIGFAKTLKNSMEIQLKQMETELTDLEGRLDPGSRQLYSPSQSPEGSNAASPTLSHQSQPLTPIDENNDGETETAEQYTAENSEQYDANATYQEMEEGETTEPGQEMDEYMIDPNAEINENSENTQVQYEADEDVTYDAGEDAIDLGDANDSVSNIDPNGDPSGDSNVYQPNIDPSADINSEANMDPNAEEDEDDEINID